MISPRFRKLGHVLMNHRQILDAAIRNLPARKAAFMVRVVEALERRPDLEDRRHLLYPVVAAAAPAIEPVLDPEEVAQAATAFLLRETEGIAATLYSPAFLTTPAQAIAPWAERLKAEIAVIILDRMAAGTLVPPDDRVWRFRSDRDDQDFPYAEDAEDA